MESVSGTAKPLTFVLLNGDKPSDSSAPTEKVEIYRVYPHSITKVLSPRKQMDSAQEMNGDVSWTSSTESQHSGAGTNRASSGKDKKREFPCLFCSQVCTTKSALWKHMGRKHPLEKAQLPSRPTLSCPECSVFRAGSHKELIQHLGTAHKHNMPILYKQFSSEEEFKIWKTKVERETSSTFSVRRGCGKNPNYSRTLYYCHRSGKFTPSRARKKRSKVHGSCKIGFMCSAFMSAKVCVKDKTVQVEYCLNHIGHTFEAVHQRLSKDLRMTIVNKLSQGMDPSDVLDDVRGEAFGTKRDSLVTLRDIHNIRHQYKIQLPTSKKKEFTCPVCNLKCKSSHGLTYHKSKKHPEVSPHVRGTVSVRECPELDEGPGEHLIQEVVLPESEHTIEVKVEECETERSEPRLDCAEPRLEFAEPRLDCGGPRLDCAEPRSNEAHMETSDSHSHGVDELRNSALDKLNGIAHLISNTESVSVLTNIYNVVCALEQNPLEREFVVYLEG